MLLLPPSLTAAGEPHPLPMERTSLTVSVVICASTEDRWPPLQGSVSSPAVDGPPQNSTVSVPSC